jgi:hypothetical protein
MFEHLRAGQCRASIAVVGTTDISDMVKITGPVDQLDPLYRREK